MMGRSRSTPNSSLPSNTINVLKRKSICMQELPTIDITRIIKDNYAHTRSVSQTRQIANSLIKHHYNQVLPKIVDCKRKAVEYSPTGAVTLPPPQKQYVRYSFKQGILGDAAPRIRFDDPKVEMLARRAEKNRALLAQRMQKLKPTTEDFHRLAEYCQKHDPDGKEFLDLYNYKEYMEQCIGTLEFEPEDCLEVLVEKTGAYLDSAAEFLRALIVKQIEAGTQDYIHLCHLLRFENLARTLVELTDNEGELRSNLTLFSTKRQGFPLYLVGAATDKNFVTFQGFQQSILEQLSKNITSLQQFQQIWARRGKNFSKTIQPLVEAEKDHRNDALRAGDVLEVALNYQEHVDRKTEALKPLIDATQ